MEIVIIKVIAVFIPWGRWLDALVNAEAITGEVVPQEIYDQIGILGI